MTLRSQILSDVSNVFMNTGDFAEEIIYYPAGVTEDARAITALTIDREQQFVGELGDVNGLATVIRVRDDATTGISATEIDTGSDEVAVSLRVGESAQRRQIVHVMSTEHGTVRFVVN